MGLVTEREDGKHQTRTTRYLYDNEDILQETDGSGKITNRYLHGPGIDEPLALVQGKTTYYYHADGLGSIVALTDSKGKVAQEYQYDSFGNLHDQMNRIKQPYTYTGREWDKETGLYFYRARYYDAKGGRFISEDPIGFAGGDVNLFGYVQNNPVNYIDPTGLEATVIATLLSSGGFSFTATGSGLNGSISGTFNTGTINYNQIRPGTYSVTPRPALSNTLTNWLFNRNKHAGRPSISNTTDWNTIRYPDGSITQERKSIQAVMAQMAVFPRGKLGTLPYLFLALLTSPL